MNTLDVTIKLNTLHCHDEGDGLGSAEPYLWTVFFKIDGDTTVVTPGLSLQGSATVVGTAGDHRDLPNHDVDPGETISIPAALGLFTTLLRPIPLQQPLGSFKEVGGVVGVITVLMEEDNTPGRAVARGHAALNAAVQGSLNALIPTLNVGHQEPTEEEIAALQQRIGETVTAAIKDGVSVWDWLGGVGNMDDKIGSEVFRFSHRALEAGGVSGITIQKRFRNEGDWELRGRVTAVPLGVMVGNLQVTLQGVPRTLTTRPVQITGPGFSRTVRTTTTLTGLPVGDYTITGHGFTTGLPNKPTCRIHTPDTGPQHRAVTAGQTSSVSVSYTSEPCNA